MKNLKNYLKFSFVITLALLTFSCEDDELGPFSDFVTTQTEEIQVTLALADRDLTGEGDALPITATISRSFEVDAQITVTTIFEDDRRNSGVITIPAGSTTGTGAIDTPFDDNLSFSNFDETGIAVATAILADDGNGIVYVAVSNEISYTVSEEFPASPVESSISIAFLWRTGTTDDYDIFYAGAAGATGNPVEFISILNTEFPDGTMQITYNPFAVAGETDVDYRLIIRTNNPANGENNITVLEGTLDAENNDPNINYPLAEITRTTSVDNSNGNFSFNVYDFNIVQLED